VALGKVTGRGAHPSGTWQGDRRGSSPEWHADGEGAELGQVVAHVDAKRRGGGWR
jgi:hypothetical protein